MTWLLSPLAWLLLACVLFPWSWLHRRRRTWPVVACSSLAVLALAAMTPLGANALMEPLERRVPTPRACGESPPSTAVVLGGGVDGRARTHADFSVLNLASRRRMDRAVAWWHDREDRVLVLQGGAPHAGVPAVAELMAAYAEALGVHAADLRVETRSGDTVGNARQAASLSPRLPGRIVLVTSMVHMPRARRAFADAGFEVCPLGTDPRRLPSRLPWALIPRTSGLANAELALHEWMGLAYYRWQHRRETAVRGE